MRLRLPMVAILAIALLAAVASCSSDSGGDDQATEESTTTTAAQTTTSAEVPSTAATSTTAPASGGWTTTCTDPAGDLTVDEQPTSERPGLDVESIGVARDPDGGLTVTWRLASLPSSANVASGDAALWYVQIGNTSPFDGYMVQFDLIDGDEFPSVYDLEKYVQVDADGSVAGNEITVQVTSAQVDRLGDSVVWVGGSEGGGITTGIFADQCPRGDELVSAP